MVWDQRITCYGRCQLTKTWMSNTKDVCCKLASYSPRRANLFCGLRQHFQNLGHSLLYGPYSWQIPCISSHTKRSPLLWLHNKSRRCPPLELQEIFIKVQRFWYFLGVYIINRTLHDRLEIRYFSSRVEKHFTRSQRSLVNNFSTLESPSGHVIDPLFITLVSSVGGTES